MRRCILAVATVLILSLAGPSAHAMQLGAQDPGRGPAVTNQDLGKLAVGDLAGSARDFVKSRTDLFASAGREDVVVTRVEHDDLGKVHVRMQETINGLQVVGGDMIVHADATSGDIYGVSGRFVSDSKLPRRAKIEATVALKEAIGALGIKEYSFLSDAELTYVVGETGKTYLAWAARVSYTSDQGPEIDVVFADARSGILVARHPEIHRALNRKTYTANHGTSLPWLAV